MKNKIYSWQYIFRFFRIPTAPSKGCSNNRVREIAIERSWHLKHSVPMSTIYHDTIAVQGKVLIVALDAKLQ